MPDTMKAIIKPDKSTGLRLVNVPIPEISPQDVLIKIKAASICGSDLPIFSWDDPWITSTVKPGQIIGHEFCGEVCRVGNNVTSIEIGALVTAEGHIFCGACFHCRTGAAHICPNQKTLGFDFPGAFAEYIKVPAKNVIILDDIPISIAAIQDPFGNAVHAISKANLLNKTILITGCGPIGLMCISLAKLSGSSRILVSDPSEYRLDIARKLGADYCFNPSKSNIKDEILSVAQESDGVDVFFEMSGNTEAIVNGFQAIRPGGKAVLLGLQKEPVFFDFANHLISKGISVDGVIGREVFKTWYETRKLLRNYSHQLYKDLETIVTHCFILEDFQKGFDLMHRGLCGKVLLMPNNENYSNK